MLTLLATLLMPAAAAAEVPDADRVPAARSRPATEVRATREKRIQLLPIRFDSRGALREGVGAGLLLELGVQLARTRALVLDANMAWVSPRVLLVPGPFRAFFAWEFGGDALVPVNRWIAAGVTGGAAFRLFRQQFNAIDETWVPYVGLRANTTFLRARKWSLAIGVRVTTDLAVTRFVMEDSRVEALSPVEGQLGLRVNFGHGPEPKPKPGSEG